MAISQPRSLPPCYSPAWSLDWDIVIVTWLLLCPSSLPSATFSLHSTHWISASTIPHPVPHSLLVTSRDFAVTSASPLFCASLLISSTVSPGSALQATLSSAVCLAPDLVAVRSCAAHTPAASPSWDSVPDMTELVFHLFPLQHLLQSEAFGKSTLKLPLPLWSPVFSTLRC